MSEKFYSRPTDKSLQAYKDWVIGVTIQLNPNAKDDLTEEQWTEKWKSFWAKADTASESQKPNEE